MRTERDEYEWGNYTKEYSGQVEEMTATAGNNGSEFLITRFGVEGDRVVFYNKLHSNWKEVYQAAFSARPETVFECGCGGMYHLKNIKTLLPYSRVYGYDLLKTQVEFGAKRFYIPKEILDGIRVLDFSSPSATTGLGTFNFVFCHAVLMHLSTDKTLQFLRNMATISNRHIMLVEGTKKHDYVQLFKEAGVLESFALTQPCKYTSESFLLERKHTCPR